MGKTNIQLKGLSQIQRKITNWTDDRIADVEQVIKQTGRAIRKEARKRAPRKTGRLRKGITFMFKKRKRTGMGGYLRAVAPHSHLIELGSVARNIPPRPFMKPAVEKIQPEYLQNIERVMNKV